MGKKTDQSTMDQALFLYANAKGTDYICKTLHISKRTLYKYIVLNDIYIERKKGRPESELKLNISDIQFIIKLFPIYKGANAWKKRNLELLEKKLYHILDTN